MNKGRLFLGLIAISGVFLGAPACADAEFTSLTKSSEGESAAVQLTMEGGGGTITCLATGTPATWVVEKGGVHVEKGPQLVTTLKSGGGCVAESSKFKTTATFSECKEEFQEPKEESSITVTVLSTCTIKAEVNKVVCEIKIEPTGNKELKEAILFNSGEKNVNTVMQYEVSKVTTHVSPACELAGIKSTTEGKLTGSSEELQLQPGFKLAVFTVGYSPNNIFKAEKEKRKANVTNGGAVIAAPTVAFESPNVGYWFITNKTACTLNYNVGETCHMEVELGKELMPNGPALWSRVKVVSPGGGGTSVVYYYR